MCTRGIGTSQPAPKTHHWPAWLTMSCTSQTHCLNKLLDPLLLLPHYMPILPLRRMRNAARNAACRRECGIPQAQAYTCLSLTQSHYLNFNISSDHLKQRNQHDVYQISIVNLSRSCTGTSINMRKAARNAECRKECGKPQGMRHAAENAECHKHKQARLLHRKRHATYPKPCVYTPHRSMRTYKTTCDPSRATEAT